MKHSFAGTIQMAWSCWLLLLSLELCCSLDPDLYHGPPVGPCLALASSCERIRYAIPFLPTESFRLCLELCADSGALGGYALCDASEILELGRQL